MLYGLPLLLLSLCYGEETKGHLDMQSTDGRLKLIADIVIASPEQGEGAANSYSIAIATYLTNIGTKTERVLLFDRIHVQHVGEKLIFTFGVGKMSDGKAVKGSLCPFMPVELRPGEIGKLAEFTTDIQDTGKVSPPRIVIYQIEKEAAALYELWEGRLEVRLNYEWPPKHYSRKSSRKGRAEKGVRLRKLIFKFCTTSTSTSAT